jgi:AraC-like DNA-binding protein
MRINFLVEQPLSHQPHPLELMRGAVSTAADLVALLGTSPAGVSDWLLVITRGGTGMLERHDRLLRLPPGSAALVPRHAPELRLAAPADGQAWDVAILRFAGATPLCEEIVTTFGNILRLPEHTAMLRQLGAIGHQASADVRVSVSEGMRVVSAMLAALIEHNRRPSAEDVPTALLRRALDLFRSACERRVTVADLAGELRTSQEHLTRMFARSLGITPGQHLQRLRVLRACELLKRTDLPVSDIALRLGYDNPTAFGRMFRGETGLSPSEYRTSDSVSLA